MGSSTVVRTLARLDPPELPTEIAEALAQPARRRHRINAANAAVAIGAAAKWPALVDEWLRDEQLGGHVLQALAFRDDEASMRFLAREIAASPREDRLLRIAERFSMKPGTLDLQLAALAADPQAASFARGHAAHLVGLYGGEEASRRLAVVTADDATVTVALAAALHEYRPAPGPRGAASGRREMSIDPRHLIVAFAVMVAAYLGLVFYGRSEIARFVKGTVAPAAGAAAPTPRPAATSPTTPLKLSATALGRSPVARFALDPAVANRVVACDAVSADGGRTWPALIEDVLQRPMLLGGSNAVAPVAGPDGRILCGDAILGGVAAATGRDDIHPAAEWDGYRSARSVCRR